MSADTCAYCGQAEGHSKRCSVTKGLAGECRVFRTPTDSVCVHGAYNADGSCCTCGAPDVRPRPNDARSGLGVGSRVRIGEQALVEHRGQTGTITEVREVCVQLDDGTEPYWFYAHQLRPCSAKAVPLEVRQLAAIAEALGNTNGDPEVSIGMAREMRSDVDRLSVQAGRAARAWEEDPTSLATENAIRELGLRARPVDHAEPDHGPQVHDVCWCGHVRAVHGQTVGCNYGPSCGCTTFQPRIRTETAPPVMVTEGQRCATCGLALSGAWISHWGEVFCSIVCDEKWMATREKGGA